MTVNGNYPWYIYIYKNLTFSGFKNRIYSKIKFNKKIISWIVRARTGRLSCPSLRTLSVANNIIKISIARKDLLVGQLETKNTRKALSYTTKQLFRTILQNKIDIQCTFVFNGPATEASNTIWASELSCEVIVSNFQVTGKNELLNLWPVYLCPSKQTVKGTVSRFGPCTSISVFMDQSEAICKYANRARNLSVLWNFRFSWSIDSFNRIPSQFQSSCWKCCQYLTNYLTASVMVCAQGKIGTNPMYVHAKHAANFALLCLYVRNDCPEASERDRISIFLYSLKLVHATLLL